LPAGGLIRKAETSEHALARDAAFVVGDVYKARDPTQQVRLVVV
jgi:hypothetical protein